ncbi:ABC transporter ATP-binding protein [Sulfurisphaera ohwakuensis]|uniref:ATP-binding cassette domain-containing protein n=1 Tax=Sulfurisphaera ohwakuensis TaxID=69656 RepID=A0A650CFW1_SULOH|nr:ABC transporter ATP-binding protein [Sulfurisphaera ohwakuensis]MBB5254059.1 multiple sugar transport system ATP-binding protein [Sulfurisphaera ohwakuensis]QGR16659.1 ATP-binding cassette domain-containing protein [Sulfurisphaera ohwakuensis]
MSYVKLEDIWKEYESKGKKVQVLRGLNLDIEKGEFVVILGPSGEGKTTILKIIAGLLRQDKGHVYLRGKIVDDLPPKDRNVAMVPQNYALYPFMSVYDNIAFPLKIAHVPKDEIKKKVEEVARMLRIDDLLDRKPSQLSGGQMQRVAIARALVKGADIILMDEPLSNLDAQVRVLAREELKQLQRSLKPTIIYVTHDQIEALSLASKVAILHEGVIQAYGDPMEIYREPNNAWVAKFLGNPPMNVLKGEIKDSSIIIGSTKIELPTKFRSIVKEGQKVLVGIRPEDLYLNDNGPLEGSVEMVEDLGPYSIIHVKIEDETIRVIEKSITRRERGEKVKLSIDTSKIVLFDQESEKNLMLLQSKVESNE